MHGYIYIYIYVGKAERRAVDYIYATLIPRSVYTYTSYYIYMLIYKPFAADLHATRYCTYYIQCVADAVPGPSRIANL